MWERGVRKPDIKTLETIGKYFEVSMGYLLGFDDASDETDSTAWGENAFEEEELMDAVLKMTRLSLSSRKIVEGAINAAYNLDRETGQLKSQNRFEVVIKKQ